MNILEMHTAFRVLLDKGSSLNYPDFAPEEIDEFLNKAQIRKVKSALTGKSLNPLRKDSVEETEKRINDLRTLTEDYRVAPLAHDANKNKVGGVFVVLPEHFMYMLDETVDIDDVDCQGVATTYYDVEIKKTTHDKFARMKKDPFNKPTLKRVLKLPFGYYDHDVTTVTALNVATTNVNAVFTCTTPQSAGTFLAGDTVSFSTYSSVILSVATNQSGLITGFTATAAPLISVTAITSRSRTTTVTSEVEEIVFDANGAIDLYKLRYIRMPRALDSDLYDSTAPDTKIVDSELDNQGNIISSATAYNTNICELPEQAHDEIVDEAIAIALEVIESKRYQSNNNEYNKVN